MITGGQNFISSPPAFSNDGKKLLVCTGNTISIFSTSTGMQITELEGHTALVTSIIVVPVAAGESKYMCYCWSSSLDGTICYWDFSSPELIKKVKVDLPIWSMAIPNISCPQTESNGKQSNLHAFVTVEDVKKLAVQHKALHGQIMLYNLTKSRRVGGLLAETRKPEAIAVSNSGEFLGIKNKRKLHIWKAPVKDFKFKELKKIKLHHTKNLSALAFHPTEKTVAGGDVTGRILIWRGFGKKTFTQDARKSSGGNTKGMEERPGVRGDDDADTCSTFHWHPTEVKFLTFSSDGAYLYSGGREGVIVVWQLDSGKKKFKPRLGSPLLYYTPSLDPSLSCISCADNQIHLLRMPSMEILKSISGIKLPFPFPEGYEGLNSRFAFDHGAGIVALQTEAYCIQFFSLFDDIEVSQVQVCQRNYQPVDDITVVVARLALSTDGSMMATVEVKLSEEGIGGLVRLKFWAHGSRAGEYTLSTVIYEPHSDAGISALEFCPNHSMAVSSSYGGDFKIWVCSSGMEQKVQMLQESGWRCQSVGSYRKKPMTAAAFSADGSILAVAAESVVTLWNPNKNILLAVIGETLAPIRKLSFVGKSEYLVTLSWGMKPQLAVWNMSKQSIAWSYKIFAEAVTSTEVGTHFAILALPPRSSDDATKRDHDGVILLFDVESPIPIATWSAKKANGGGLAFTPARLNSQVMEVAGRKAPSMLLAYINTDHEFVLFDPYSSEEHQIYTDTSGSHTAVEETELFGYASIYGELPEFDLKKEQIPRIPFVPSEKPWETIFSGSSQVLPPLTELCSAFLASLLEKKPIIKG